MVEEAQELVDKEPERYQNRGFASMFNDEDRLTTFSRGVAVWMPEVTRKQPNAHNVVVFGQLDEQGGFKFW